MLGLLSARGERTAAGADGGIGFALCDSKVRFTGLKRQLPKFGAYCELREVGYAERSQTIFIEC